MNELIKTDLDYILEKLFDELDSFSGGRLLMTGGAGFIGYYLIQSLLRGNTKRSFKEPLDIVLLDNFIRGVPEWIKDYEDDIHFAIAQHDVSKKLPEDIGIFTHVIHAASIASPIFYRKYPIETMDANVNGLRNLLDYFRQGNNLERLKCFLFFSSSEVYGDPTPENIPTSEKYWGNVSFTGPRACYDESKRFGETLAVNYAKVYSVPIKIVRPFNNYGIGLKLSDRRVISDFASNILNGEDIVLLSDGTPTRTFCYSADAIVGHLKVLVKGHIGEPYNIGSDKPEISISQLANMCVSVGQELFGYSGKVVYKISTDKQYTVDNPNRRCPDITKARTELGFSPTIDMKEGLRRAFMWYKDQKNNGVEL